MEPYEIVATPLTVYVAPVGTPFPAIDEAEAAFNAGWFKLGTSGAKNYDDAGVTVSHEQTIETFRGAGSTLPRKGWRTEEDIVFGFKLVDVSAAQYAKILNDAAITTTAPSAGVAGQDVFDLVQGVEVGQLAVLARGVSPEDEQFAAQYQAPRCYEGSSARAVQYGKTAPAGLECEFRTLDSDDPTELVIQTGVAI
jgi:hypothetical protein